MPTQGLPEPRRAHDLAGYRIDRSPLRVGSKIVLANAIAIAAVTGWDYFDYLEKKRNQSGGRHEDH